MAPAALDAGLYAKFDEDAVRARLRRQELLYDGTKRFNILIGETALRALICPPAVLAAQLRDLIRTGLIPRQHHIEHVAVDGVWMVKIGLVTFVERHIGEIPVIGILLDKHDVLLADGVDYRPCDGRFA